MTGEPLETWLRVQAAVWLPALGVIACWPAAGIGTSVPLIPGAMAVSFVFLLRSLRSGRTLADHVTTLRFMGLVAWLGLVPAPLGPWTWGAAVAIAAADLLDGAVARRFGSARHGALLDMETDQFVVLGFALAVVAGGGAVHVLVLPALRYGFVLAAWWLRLPANDPKPVRGDNRRGRFVCAAVVIGLLMALHPAVPRAAANGITAIAVLLLTWSFAGDAKFLLAHRAGRAA